MYRNICIYIYIIKLDQVNGSKLRFGGQIRKFKKNELFEKFHKIFRVIRAYFGVKDWR